MPKRKLPPNEQICQLYASGRSSGEIAEMFGVAPITVLSLFRRIGMICRKPEEYSRIREQNGRAKKVRYWLGKKQPLEMVEKRISAIRGERHWAWKDGKSKRDYRKKIDKQQCSRCGSSLNLAIHHKNLDHYDNNPDNLLVLCVSCHSSVHKKIYWDAVHAGKKPPSTNAPIGWGR